jgi:predicted TPR repeat methyltransferase
MLKKVKMNQRIEYWNTIGRGHMMCPDPYLYKLTGSLGIDLRGKNVLDLGFGEGQDLFEMQRRGANPYGMDVDQRIVDKINKSKGFDQFPVVLHGDISTDIGQFQETFDLIYSLEVLFYLDDDYFKLCLINVKKKLSSDGTFIFHVLTGDYSIVDCKEVPDPTGIITKENPVIFRKQENYFSLLQSEGFNVIAHKTINESVGNHCKKGRHHLYICASFEA